MPRLFNRVAKVSVVRRQTIQTGGEPQFFSREGDAIEITGLRIRFEVSKNLGKEPNKCVVKIHNLAETTRSDLERGIIQVTLHAGHDGVFRLIATGDLRRASSQREGTDIVTTLQVTDGFRAFAHARMSRSYKPPITVGRVLSDAAKSMGLQLPDEVLQSVQLNQKITDGISIHGPTRDTLTKLLAPFGYGWSIQNGKLQILRDEDLRPSELIVINQGAGLIGIPERTFPDKAGGKSEVKFDVLLYPEIIPGSKVKLESELIRMSLKVTDVSHSGDTHGGEMKTSVSARPLAA
jgi:hypothetical protein